MSESPELYVYLAVMWLKTVPTLVVLVVDPGDMPLSTHVKIG